MSATHGLKGILGVDGTSYTSKPTGAIRRTCALLPRLSSLGWKINLFVPEEHATTFSHLEGVQTFPLPAPHRPGPLRPLVAGRKLQRAFHQTKCELLLTETPPVPPGLPFVLTVHDFHAWDVPFQSGVLRSLWIRSCFPQAIREAESLIVVSEFSASRLRKHFPGTPCKVVLNGSNHFPSYGAEPSSKTNWLSVGPWDSLSQPKLFQGLPGQVTMVGNYKKALPKNTVLVQPSDFKLSELYKSSKALICTSPYEGFNLPLVEALAHGCPVAATDIPVHREVGGKAARYFTAGNLSSLRACLKDLETNPPSAQELQEQAQLFSWEQSAQKLDSILQEALRSESARAE